MTTFHDLNKLADAYHGQYREESGQFFEKLGVSADVVDRLKLGWIHEPLSPEHAAWKGADLVPYLSADGNVVQIRAAAFSFDRDDDPTQIMLETVDPKPRPRIFGVGHTLPGLRTNRVVVVHDVISCLLLRSFGYRSVALPGSHWEHPWRLLFSNADIVHVVQSRERMQHWQDYWRKCRMAHRMVRTEGRSVSDLGLTSAEEYEHLLGMKP